MMIKIWVRITDKARSFGGDPAVYADASPFFAIRNLHKLHEPYYNEPLYELHSYVCSGNRARETQATKDLFF